MSWRSRLRRARSSLRRVLPEPGATTMGCRSCPGHRRSTVCGVRPSGTPHCRSRSRSSASDPALLMSGGLRPICTSRSESPTRRARMQIRPCISTTTTMGCRRPARTSSGRTTTRRTARTPITSTPARVWSTRSWTSRTSRIWVRLMSLRRTRIATASTSSNTRIRCAAPTSITTFASCSLRSGRTRPDWGSMSSTAPARLPWARSVDFSRPTSGRTSRSTPQGRHRRPRRRSRSTRTMTVIRLSF